MNPAVIDSLLFQLILLLALTAAGLALFERLKLPAIAGFLVAGAIAGPGGFGIIDEPENVRSLAELGVVFLLFEIGLELPIERVRKLWRTAVLAGGAQMILTGGLVMAAAMFLGIGSGEAFILGSIIAMSSTALVMRILGDRGQLQAPQGQLALSILVFQDLSIVPLLLLFPLLHGGGESATDILLTVLRMLGALVLVFVTVRIVVPRVLLGGARRRSADLFSLLALLVVLGSAYFAEEVGLSLAVGAFLAGLAAGDSPFSSQMFSEVVPLRGVLLGIFFTAIGMLFEPTVFAHHATGLLAYLAAATIVKALIIVAITLVLLRQGLRVGILTGLALAQTGEFSFVFTQDAVRAGMLSPELSQIVIAGSILSLIATPFLIRGSPRLVDAIERRRSPGTASASLGEEPHVIVVGFGPGGQTLVRLLRSLEIPYRIVEANTVTVEQARQQGERITFGDATRPAVLQRMQILGARLLAVAISDPFATRRIVSRARHLAPNTPILARTRFVEEVDGLTVAGASEVVAEEFEGSLEFTARALSFFGFPTDAVRDLTDSLRAKGYRGIRDSASHPIETTILETLKQINVQWIEIPDDYQSDRSLASLESEETVLSTVLAVQRDGQTRANPEASFVFQSRDRVLVSGNAESVESVTRLFRGD